MYSGDTVSNLVGTMTILCEGFGYLCVYLQEDFGKYEGWNFNSGNYLFTTDTK